MLTGAEKTHRNGCLYCYQRRHWTCGGVGGAFPEEAQPGRQLSQLDVNQSRCAGLVGERIICRWMGKLASSPQPPPQWFQLDHLSVRRIWITRLLYINIIQSPKSQRWLVRINHLKSRVTLNSFYLNMVMRHLSLLWLFVGELWDGTGLTCNSQITLFCFSVLMEAECKVCCVFLLYR